MDRLVCIVCQFLDLHPGKPMDGMAAVHVGILAATEENLNWLVQMFSQAHGLGNNMTAALSR